LTHVSALSDGTDFDPPINVATAMSEFYQPDFKDATVRGMSFALSDYDGHGGTQGYQASTSFTLQQLLTVQVGGFVAGAPITLKLLVPMHGLMAARGTLANNSLATANMDVSAAIGSNVIDTSAGSLQLTATDLNVFSYSATGDWAGTVAETDVNLPTGDQPRSSRGIEMTSSAALDLGTILTGSSQAYTIKYSMFTSVTTPDPNGKFALSDFSGTGGVTFAAFDAQGNPFTDFTVNAVPEPASFAAFGLGLAAILRRRVQHRARR
jgi:hypothetical protein